MWFFLAVFFAFFIPSRGTAAELVRSTNSCEYLTSANETLSRVELLKNHGFNFLQRVVDYIESAESVSRWYFKAHTERCLHKALHSR